MGKTSDVITVQGNEHPGTVDALQHEFPPVASINASSSRGLKKFRALCAFFVFCFHFQKEEMQVTIGVKNFKQRSTKLSCTLSQMFIAKIGTRKHQPKIFAFMQFSLHPPPSSFTRTCSTLLDQTRSNLSRK